MDVLSPHILPPSNKRRSENTSNHREALIKGTVNLKVARSSLVTSLMPVEVKGDDASR